jgi:hypothetical protein
MRVQTVCIISCAATIVLLCGCSSRSGSIAHKRQFATNRIQHEYINARSPIYREWGTNILSALATTNNVALETPQFASAAMGRDQDGEYKFFVFWLEDRPTVDCIELQLDKAGSTANIPISESDIEENLKASKVSVVMVASWTWPAPNSSAIWSKFEKIGNVSDLKIRLLSAGTPVTGWNPVSFYQLDRWMGTTEAIKKLTGPSIDPKARN